MINFFRKIRFLLLHKKRFNKYFIYALGEILLVVIGILIAVGIGEWRFDIKKEKELIAYYQGLSYDLNQDKKKLESLITLYDNTITAIVAEVDRMQLSSYNEETLYKNVPSWMVYTTEFAPNKSTFTEIISSGKLQLFHNKKLKTQVLDVYGNLYPEIKFRQNTINEFIRNLRTDVLMDTYRWMNILDNDKNPNTDLILKNPKFKIHHQWVKNKQSVKYLKFENYLNLIRAGYIDSVKRYKNIKSTLETLVLQINNELEQVYQAN